MLLAATAAGNERGGGFLLDVGVIYYIILEMNRDRLCLLNNLVAVCN